MSVRTRPVRAGEIVCYGKNVRTRSDIARAGKARRRRQALLSTIVLFIVGLAASDALAWGKLGHRAASAVAERRLTPAAGRAVRELLEPGESLADASLWADDHRKDLAGSAGWHFVDVPILEPRYRAIFCPETGCVVSKITDEEKILGDAAASRAERRQALLLLVHLVEDVHQPLHVGDRHDRGGNDLHVRFFEQVTNLHHLWDDDLLERHSTDEAAWIEELDSFATPARSRAWAAVASPEQWADESLAAAREAYRSPTTGLPLPPGALLGEAYFEAALPVVRCRLAQAAVRLAAVLNHVLR